MKITFGQLIRYGIVGLLSNLLAYILYLALTHFGTPPKLAMSFLYCVGVAQTFVFNKSWSFDFTGPQAPAFIRYAALYAVGYLINYSSMTHFIDNMNMAHEIVMGVLTVFMAAFFFLGQKFFVFPPHKMKQKQ